MANVKDITTMCKAGQVQEAYELAKTDLAARPADIWAQRAVGWVLYYMIKADSEVGDYAKLLEHINELKSLDQLTIANDSMIFDNVQFQIANFIKNNIFLTDIEASSKLSTLFSKFKDYEFKPSIGHSFLLQAILKFENWYEMPDFFDWWNLDDLSSKDYEPYVNQKGQKKMTLAERAFIANSKALLRLNDLGRIEEFLPKLDNLMNNHKEMMYPGYFYGKLLLALGSNRDEALKVIIPFARKKATEFWVWQLLSDVFTDDEDKQLACLLRAVHCRTQETFLGKVHIKLANLYIKRGLFNSARYHIDAVTRCYVSQGWRLPNEIDCWIHQPWLNSTIPDGNVSIDYMSITDAILCNGAEECIAVVTYVDQTNHKAFIIYGKEKRTVQKLRFRVQAGNILKLHYITDNEGRMKIISSTKFQLPSNLNYAKYVEGKINKRDDKEFAFLKSGSISCFVSPNIVKKYKLKNGDNIKSLIIYDYDKKEECMELGLCKRKEVKKQYTMKELTHNAKIAVLKILNDIVNADNIVKDVEVDYMNEIARSFELADNYMVEVNNLVTLQALAIVRTLSTDLKQEIAQMMGKMIVIDKDINYNEVKLYNAVCESCNIERNFIIEDYPPEVTISGAYVNLK